MRLEVQSAANLLVHLLKVQRRQGPISDTQLEMFKYSFVEVLYHRYHDHWFPDCPTKGSGYRCIRINGRIDPVLAQAGFACGLPEQFLQKLLPKEFTLWVDPAEVSYRFGENGSICVLYEGGSDPAEPEFLTASTTVKDQSNNGSTTNSTCKVSLRQADMFMDPRNVRVGSFEQMAKYVSIS